MFYCSKCAINLLQQGFKIDELKADEEAAEDRTKAKEIGRAEMKIKLLEEKLKRELHLSSFDSCVEEF